jgi:hypothetical protein
MVHADRHRSWVKSGRNGRAALSGQSRSASEVHTCPVPLIAANPGQRSARQESACRSRSNGVGTPVSALDVGRGVRTIERPEGRGYPAVRRQCAARGSWDRLDGEASCCWDRRGRCASAARSPGPRAEGAPLVGRKGGMLRRQNFRKIWLKAVAESGVQACTSQRVGASTLRTV